MKAGGLKRRIQVLAPVEVVLSSGGVKTGWSLIMTVWGSIEPLTGKEFYLAKQVDSDVTHNIIMRFNKIGITPSYRLVHKDQIFEISSKLNIEEQNRQFTIKAIERTGVVKDFVVKWVDDDSIVHWVDDGMVVFSTSS